MKQRYNQKALANTAYSVGDLVMLRNSVTENDKSRKFHLPYCKLFRIVEVLPPANDVIKSLDDGSTTKFVHFLSFKKELWKN